MSEIVSKVKVQQGFLAFMGWKGTLTIDGDVAKVTGTDNSKELTLDFSNVKSASFNSNNGLWAFKLKDGKRLVIQSAGAILSADRTENGERNNQKIGELLEKYQVKFFTV